MPAKTGVINVPFCPESKLSGVNRRIIPDEVLLYGRKFEVPQEWKGKRLIIHFGAVDQTAKVYVDGRYAGSHEGGYLPFSLDITDKLRKSKDGDSDDSADTVHSLIHGASRRQGTAACGTRRYPGYGRASGWSRCPKSTSRRLI